ncbi:hypothetical protein ASE70_14910 [Sphingomonas sp. Leaf22]|uniref:hypothetical protein n=1 Tax=Sphingomonas sp. Leaf22 TaxID=1735687 RepID=UPI0006FA6C91|nr:hypothetical protein [Sphingomonas sp. Leaf22]KQM92202.1 hypothetical protein ASE70_14910 [Sphingomonas sp. Leaf22]
MKLSPRSRAVLHTRALSKPPMGRQPEVCHIIPSKPNPWYGGIVEGDPLTVQQRWAMTKRGMPADVETITVRRLACLIREVYAGSNAPRPYYEFQCPVQSRQKDGRIYVISPSGDRKLVQADGWIR